MKIKEFQELSKRTFNFNVDYDKQLLNCCLGIHGESGEVADVIKKSVFQGHEMNVNHIEEELGDVLFYIVNLASVLNLEMENILESNYLKLKTRYPNGFNTKDSIKRVDKLNQ